MSFKLFPAHKGIDTVWAVEMSVFSALQLANMNVVFAMFQGPHSVDFHVCPNTCIFSFGLVDVWSAEGAVVKLALITYLQMHPAFGLLTH